MATTEEVILKATAVDEASGIIDKIGGKMGGLGGITDKAGALMKGGMLAGATAVTGLGIASLKMAVDFEGSFGEVKTLLPGLSEEAFGKLQDDFLAFTKDMGIATDQAIPALYQAISAGVPPENVMSFMETAAKTSIGGCTDLTTAVDGISSVVNAYGSNVLDASTASDIMFSAVRLGKTNIEQLSASLFQVIPTASSLGISFEEVTAALTVMTSQGVPTSVATTQLRQALVEASKGGTLLDGAIRDLTGKGFADLIGEGQSASGIFEQLRESMPEQDFKNLFGSVEAMNAVLAITGPNADKMAGNLEEMQTASGATDKAFETMAKTVSFKFDKAMNYLKVSLMEVGLKVLPMLTQALEKVLPWLEDNLPGAMKKAQETIDAIAQALKPFFEAFVSGLEVIMPKLKQFGDWVINNKPALVIAIGAVGVAIVLAFGPASLAIAAIVGIIAAIGYFSDNWTAIQTKIEGAIDAIVAKVTGLPVIGQFFQAAYDVIAEKVQAIVDAIQTIIDIAQSVISFFQNVFSGDWSAAWTDLKDIATGILQLFTDWLDISFIGTIKTLFESMKPWEWVTGALAEFTTQVHNLFTDIVTWFENNWKTALVTLFTGLPGLLLYLFRDEIQKKFGEIAGALLGVGSNMVDQVIKGFTDAPNLIATKVVTFTKTALAFVFSLPSKLWNIGQDMIHGLWNGIEALKDWLWGKIGDFFGGILDEAKDALGDLWPFSPSAAGVKVGEGFGLGIMKGLATVQPAVMDAFGNFPAKLPKQEWGPPGAGAGLGAMGGLTGAAPIQVDLVGLFLDDPRVAEHLGRRVVEYIERKFG